MSDLLAEQVKKIYSAYHAGDISPEQALEELELAFANEND
jgi:hypothetical protein